MPWNSGGNDPTPGPWGPPGGRPPNGGNRGPWGGGGGGGPNGQLPDIEQLLARAQAWLRGFLPGRRGRRPGLPGMPRAGGRGLILLAVLLVAVWLATGFYRVQPDEQGVVLRFGAFDRTSLPGLNYHIPWPVETALTPSVTHINRVEVGFRPANDSQNLRMTSRGLVADGAGGPPQSVPAESLMLTGDENIIDIDFAVFWRVRNAGDYLFNTRRPDQTVKAIAESVMREVIGHTPIQPALTEARARIEQSVLTGMQAVLDQYRAGVEITQVQLQKVDPPTEVIESFRDVQRANTDAERMRNEAESYRNDIVPRARGDAARITAEADGARQASIAEATGQAQRFLSVYAAYQLAKDVTLRRLYIETMQQILTRTPTVVVDQNVRGLLPLLNLNEPAAVPWSQAMNRPIVAALVVVAVIAVLASASLFTVEQTEQVLITQLGQPIRVISEPGLHAKIPFVQTVISFDRRLLDYSTPGEEVILSDQRRLIVDSFTRYHITDPLQYYQAVGAQEDAVRARLNSVVTSSLRRVLGGETLLAVLSTDRGRIMGLIRSQVSDEMRSFGVTIEDVRIRRADLPEENTQAILNRMKSERQRAASQARAEGAETSARIRADAERDRTVLLAEAKATADKLRGEGERTAIATYADAFQRDPQFFSVWRTLQAYRDGFGGGQSRLLVSTDDDFFKLLHQAPQAAP